MERGWMMKKEVETKALWIRDKNSNNQEIEVFGQRPEGRKKSSEQVLSRSLWQCFHGEGYWWI